MSSLLPGFEYDIFISYRQKDNKYDGWVTEFVANLKKELEATFKEDISIYFDANPHDGLLETHNVDKSLEGKLKCLIFIPIISQTYCDIKSFAWQQELCAFNKLANEDPFGRDVKVSNGNVASRILPIRIHDLDDDDKKLLEHELGGVLRAIEFIYRESGVNRPLKPADQKQDNLNKTDYRNQVNKVANAIKELIGGIRSAKNLRQSSPAVSKQPDLPLSIGKKLAWGSALVGLLCLTAYVFYYFGGHGSKSDPTTEKSIAVLPFVNMSNDPEQEYFSDGISEELLNLLAKVPELKVIGRTSSFYFKGKNEDLRVIGDKLGVANLLEGSIRKDGTKIRITAQLIRVSDGTHLWSETYDRKLEGIFALQDEIAAAVLKQLKLKLLGTSSLLSSSVDSKEVHSLLLKGNFFYDKGGTENYRKAGEFFKQALALDSTSARIWTSLAKAEIVLANGSFTEYEKLYVNVAYHTARALSLDNQWYEAHRLIGVSKVFHEFDWTGAEQELNIAMQLEPGNPDVYRNLAQLEYYQGHFNKALDYINKGVELNPFSWLNVGTQTQILFMGGRIDETIQILEKTGMELNPALAHRSLAIYYLASDRPAQALQHAQQLLEDDAFRLRLLAMAYYGVHREKEAIDLLTQYANNPATPSFALAEVYTYMNQREKGLQSLEKAYVEKFTMWSLKSNPLLRKLKGEPRYTELLRKMNLPLD